MPYRTVAVSLAAAALVISGCARSRITTEIKPDGSWLRTVVFTGSEKKEGSMAPAIEDSFVLPSGAAWKSHEGKKNDDRVLTYERTMAAGASLKGDISIKGDGGKLRTYERTMAAGASLKGDISIKGDGGKLSLVNEATVTRSGPNRFEYRETLRWTGDPPDSATVKPETLVQIKAALPKPLATDANARALAGKGQELLIPLLFGPGDPLLALGLLHPDLAERRARQRIGTLMLKVLEDQFGNQLTPDQRREVARRLISDSFSTSRPSPPDPTSGEKSKGSGGLTPLMFIVKMPGRVVSSNGEVDDLGGEVYWALFPEAASLRNLVLTATCELGQK